MKNAYHAEYFDEYEPFEYPHIYVSHRIHGNYYIQGYVSFLNIELRLMMAIHEAATAWGEKNPNNIMIAKINDFTVVGIPIHD